MEETMDSLAAFDCALLEDEESALRSRCNTWPRNDVANNEVDAMPLLKEEDVKKEDHDAQVKISVPFSPPTKSTCSRRNPWGNVSYADLITQAIQSSPDQRLTLAQIYEWIAKNVPYFHGKGDSVSSSGWKNSIRHNLSLHNRFVRVQNEGSGKSSWWMVNADAALTKTASSKAPRKRANTFDNSKFEHRGRKNSRAAALRLKNKNSPQMRRSVSNNSLFNNNANSPAASTANNNNNDTTTTTATTTTANNNNRSNNDNNANGGSNGGVNMGNGVGVSKTFNIVGGVHSPFGNVQQPQSPDLLSSSFRPRTYSSPCGRLSPYRERASSTASTSSTHFLSTEELLRKFDDVKTEDDAINSPDVDLADLAPFDAKLDSETTEELMNELIKAVDNGNNPNFHMINMDQDMDAMLDKIKILEPRMPPTPTSSSPSPSFLFQTRIGDCSGGVVSSTRDLNIAYPMELSLQSKSSFNRRNAPLTRQQLPATLLNNGNEVDMVDMDVPPSSASSGLGHEMATHLSTVSETVEDHEEEMNPLFEQLASSDFDLDLNPTLSANPLSVGGFTSHQSLLFRSREAACTAQTPNNNASKTNHALSMSLF